MNPSESISRKVVSGGLWIFTLRIAQQILGIVKLIVLALFLAPYDFGLVGIALLTISIVDVFSQTGFQQALVYRKGSIEGHLDAAWTFLVFRGIALFLILFVLAYPAAELFRSPEATPIIQVAGVSFLLQAFSNIGVVYFQKNLEFRKQFVYMLSGTVMDFSVAIGAAVIFQNAWALVAGLLAGSAIKLIASYLIHPSRPRFSLEWSRAKDLFGYGKWVFWSGVLVFAVTQGDGIVVGAALGATALGLYQMACKFSNAPVTEVTHVLSQVTFPAFSRLQNELERVRDAYVKVLQVAAYASFAMAAAIFALAPEFVGVFLGEEWESIVPVIMVLAIAGLLRSIGATGSSVLAGIGKPKTEAKWQSVRFIVLAVLIYPFILEWDIVGAALAVLISAAISTVGLCYSVSHAIDCSYHAFWKALAVPTTLFLVSSATVAVSRLVIPLHGMSQLAVLTVLGIGTFFLLTYAFDKYLGWSMRHMFREILGSLGFARGIK